MLGCFRGIPTLRRVRRYSVSVLDVQFAMQTQFLEVGIDKARVLAAPRRIHTPPHRAIIAAKGPVISGRIVVSPPHQMGLERPNAQAVFIGFVDEKLSWFRRSKLSLHRALGNRTFWLAAFRSLGIRFSHAQRRQQREANVLVHMSNPPRRATVMRPYLLHNGFLTFTDVFQVLADFALRNRPRKRQLRSPARPA